MIFSITHAKGVVHVIFSQSNTWNEYTQNSWYNMFSSWRIHTVKSVKNTNISHYHQANNGPCGRL